MFEWLDKFKYVSRKQWTGEYGFSGFGVVGYQNGFGKRKLKFIGCETAMKLEAKTKCKAMYWLGGGNESWARRLKNAILPPSEREVFLTDTQRRGILILIRKQEPRCRMNMLTNQFLSVEFDDHLKALRKCKHPNGDGICKALTIYPQTIRELIAKEFKEFEGLNK